MDRVYLPSNHKNFSILSKYHLCEEYRTNIKEKAKICIYKKRAEDRFKHYEKLANDDEYFIDCKLKGLRIQNPPEEFKDILNEKLKNFIIQFK